MLVISIYGEDLVQGEGLKWNKKLLLFTLGNVLPGSLMVTSFKPIKAFGSNYTQNTLDSFLLSHAINKPQSMVRHNKKAVVLLLYCVMIPRDPSYQNKSH